MNNKTKTIIFTSLIVLGAFLGFRWYANRKRLYAELISNRRLIDIGIAFHWFAGPGSKSQVLPAYSLDSNAQPGLSWRVLLLPYLGELELYEKFRLDEPWDSPSNIELAKQLPTVYRSQFCQENDEGLTSFIVVVSPESAFPPVVEGQSLSFDDITDGLSRTLLAIELPEAPQIWTKPDSLTPQEISVVLKHRKSGKRLFMNFLDGSVVKFESYVGDDTFNSFCTRSGNDIVDPKSVPGVLPFP